MYKHKLAVIIPTMNRPDELVRLFDSMITEEVIPSQIIVVDAGTKEITHVLDRYPRLSIEYARAPQPSITGQRNAGIRMLKDGISLVAFFDDDIILLKDSMRQLMGFWDAAPDDVGGVTFNNLERSFETPAFFERIFMVKGSRPGQIIRSGFQSLPCSVDRTMEVDWVMGCSMVFRRKIFSEFSFDEWFDGYAVCEDADFSHRVAKKYRLFVVADAKIRHFSGEEPVERSFQYGKMQVINRYYFVRKHADLSKVLCLWACFGLLLNNCVKALAGQGRRYRFRAKGIFSGFISLITKGVVRANNHETNIKS